MSKNQSIITSVFSGIVGVNICLALFSLSTAARAIPSPANAVKKTQKPYKVACGFLTCDEIAMHFVENGMPIEKIAALSSIADNKSYSPITQQAKQVKNRFSGNLEQVLSLKGLSYVVLSEFNDEHYQKILAAKGIRTQTIVQPSDMASWKKSLDAIAETFKEPEIQLAYHREIENGLKRLGSKCKKTYRGNKGRRPPQLLRIFPENNSVSGQGSFFSAVAKASCAVNALDALDKSSALTGWPRLSKEKLLSLPVDYVITSKDFRSASKSSLRHHEFWKYLFQSSKPPKIIEIEENLLATQSHHLLKLIEKLQHATR